MTNDNEYKRELARINLLEQKYHQREKDIDFIRSQTQACPTTGLDTPRRCYIDSDYACTWYDRAQRCDLK